jgi:hypothetical protein
MRKYIIRRFGMYQYVLVCTKKALSEHGIYQYIQYQGIEGFSIWGQCFDVAKWMYTLPMYSTTYPGVQSEKKPYVASLSRTWYVLVHTSTYYHVLTHKGHSHFSLRIMLYPPCDADESPIHA